MEQVYNFLLVRFYENKSTQQAEHFAQIISSTGRNVCALRFQNTHIKMKVH